MTIIDLRDALFWCWLINIGLMLTHINAFLRR